jgi:hypothetical protein
MYTVALLVTPFGALLDVVLDRILHTTKILNMFRCDDIPRSGCVPLKENASGFIYTINTSFRNGE